MFSTISFFSVLRCPMMGVSDILCATFAWFRILPFVISIIRQSKDTLSLRSIMTFPHHKMLLLLSLETSEKPTVAVNDHGHGIITNLTHADSSEIVYNILHNLFDATCSCQNGFHYDFFCINTSKSISLSTTSSSFSTTLTDLKTVSEYLSTLSSKYFLSRPPLIIVLMEEFIPSYNPVLGQTSDNSVSPPWSDCLSGNLSFICSHTMFLEQSRSLPTRRDSASRLYSHRCI